MNTLARRHVGAWSSGLRRVLPRVQGVWRQVATELLSAGFMMKYYTRSRHAAGLAGNNAFRVWRERITLIRYPRTSQGKQPRMWVHIAGPGDALAAQCLVDRLRQAGSHPELVFTCDSTAARTIIVTQVARAGESVYWFPFDIRWCMARFVRANCIGYYVSMQGDIWPALLGELKRRTLPVVMLRMDMLDWNCQAEYPDFVRPYYEDVLQLVGAYSCRSDADAARLQASGVLPERTRVGGDYRIEVLCAHPLTRIHVHRPQGHGIKCVTWLGPRDDEIDQLLPTLAAFASACKAILVLVPVAEDSRRYIEHALIEHGMPYHGLVVNGGVESEPTVQVFESFGGLPWLFQFTTVAVIGDTFGARFGCGRNLWEPVSVGVRAVYGPSMPASEPVASLETTRAGVRVNDVDGLITELRGSLQHPMRRGEVRAAFDRICDDNGEASAQDWELLQDVLNKQRD